MLYTTHESEKSSILTHSGSAFLSSAADHSHLPPFLHVIRANLAHRQSPAEDRGVETVRDKPRNPALRAHGSVHDTAGMHVRIDHKPHPPEGGSLRELRVKPLPWGRFFRELRVKPLPWGRFWRAPRKAAALGEVFSRAPRKAAALGEVFSRAPRKAAALGEVSQFCWVENVPLVYSPGTNDAGRTAIF